MADVFDRKKYVKFYEKLHLMHSFVFTIKKKNGKRVVREGY